jgi:aquaporin Z
MIGSGEQMTRQAQDNRKAPEQQEGKGSGKEEQQDSLLDECRRLLAELVGTFALTFVAAGGAVISVLSHGKVTPAAALVAPGLVIMVMTYALANSSGAHFNPTVTLAFALRRDFPWRQVPGYWIAQFAGAILAALLLRGLFGLVGNVGITRPHYGTIPTLVMETILTFFLITVILGTATNHKLTGHNAAIAVGATIALDGLFAGPISDASMNPARSLGPFLVSGHLADVWIYFAGPLAGMLLAVLVAYLIRGGTTHEAAETAKGDR